MSLKSEGCIISTEDEQDRIAPNSSINIVPSEVQEEAFLVSSIDLNLNSSPQQSHEIFGHKIGQVFEEYSCFNLFQNGNLYTGSKAIGFFSNKVKVFGFERKIIIPLDTITDLVRVEKSKRDICIKTNTGINHTFKELQNRDMVLTSIYELAKHGPGGYATAQRNIGLIVSMAELNPKGVVRLTPPLSPQEKDVMARQLISSVADFVPLQITPRANSLPSMSSKDVNVNMNMNMNVNANVDVCSKSKSLSLSSKDSNKNLLEKTKTNTNTKINHCRPMENINICTKTKLSPPKFKILFPKKMKKGKQIQTWTELKASKFTSLKDTGIKHLKLSCSLETFFEKFLANDAPHSIQQFQNDHIGDFDLHTSSWEQEHPEHRQTMTRSITYKHPMNIPMAPPSARAIKEQTLHNYAPYGICIETQTTSYDAPTTDCFTVHDAIVIEPTDDGGIAVQIKFEVRFVKYTMFRTFVELTTRGEFTKWFQGFARMLVNVMTEGTLTSNSEEVASLISENEIARKDPPAQAYSNNMTAPLVSLLPSSWKNSTPSLNKVLSVGMIFTLILQVTMMLKLNSFQSTLSYNQQIMTHMIMTHEQQVKDLSSVILKLQAQLQDQKPACDAVCQSLHLASIP